MTKRERSIGTERFVIRSYRHEDRAAVRELFYRGRLDGRTDEDPRDTGADMDSIECSYFAQPQDHFWVAESDGRIVGLVGVTEMEPGVSEILRLRIDLALRETDLVNRLLTTALQHCTRHGVGKVLLNTFVDHQQAMRIFAPDLQPHIRTYRDRGNRARIELCSPEVVVNVDSLPEAV